MIVRLRIAYTTAFTIDELERRVEDERSEDEEGEHRETGVRLPLRNGTMIWGNSFRTEAPNVTAPPTKAAMNMEPWTRIGAVYARRQQDARNDATTTCPSLRGTASR